MAGEQLPAVGDPGMGHRGVPNAIASAERPWRSATSARAEPRSRSRIRRPVPPLRRSPLRPPAPRLDIAAEEVTKNRLCQDQGRERAGGVGLGEAMVFSTAASAHRPWVYKALSKLIRKAPSKARSWSRSSTSRAMASASMICPEENRAAVRSNSSSSWSGAVAPRPAMPLPGNRRPYQASGPCWPGPRRGATARLRDRRSAPRRRSAPPPGSAPRLLGPGFAPRPGGSRRAPPAPSPDRRPRQSGRGGRRGGGRRHGRPAFPGRGRPIARPRRAG